MPSPTVGPGGEGLATLPAPPVPRPRPAVHPAPAMAQPGGGPVGHGNGREPALSRLGPWLCALVTLLVTGWRAQVPSFWRDEGATLSAVHRGFPELLSLLGRMDAVHGAYYLLMWPEVRLFGSSAAALRLPSAVAMAATAGLVTALGRRLVSLRAGLAAGLVFAAVPAVSWFGQDARPFAMVAAASAAASYCLARLLEAGRPRRWATWYAVSLVALGLANLFGLLLVAAHAITVTAVGRSGPSRRYWVAAVAAAAGLLTPLGALAWTQRGQVGWVRTPLLGAVTSTERLIGSPGPCLAVAVILAAGLLASALRGRARLRTDWPARLPAFCVPWLLVPPALLIAVSWAQPVYTFRYVVFCIPAAALLTGAGLAAAGRVTGVAGLALIVILGLPGQFGERGPAGHLDDIRGMDRVLAVQALPGDAVIYPQGPGMRSFAAAYPYGLARLRDVMISASPAASRTISGTDAAPPVIRGRLAHVTRVWVAEANKPWPGPPALLQGLPFEPVRAWRITDIYLWLYVRR